MILGELIFDMKALNTKRIERFPMALVKKEKINCKGKAKSGGWLKFLLIHFHFFYVYTIYNKYLLSFLLPMAPHYVLFSWYFCALSAYGFGCVCVVHNED